MQLSYILHCKSSLYPLVDFQKQKQKTKTKKQKHLSKVKWCHFHFPSMFHIIWVKSTRNDNYLRKLHFLMSHNLVSHATLMWPWAPLSCLSFSFSFSLLFSWKILMGRVSVLGTHPMFFPEMQLLLPLFTGWKKQIFLCH